MENFMYGTSSVYGSLICKPSQLTEVKEEIFFNMIKNSLKEYKLEKFASDAMKKTNLKKVLQSEIIFSLLQKELINKIL